MHADRSLLGAVAGDVLQGAQDGLGDRRRGGQDGALGLVAVLVSDVGDLDGSAVVGSVGVLALHGLDGAVAAGGLLVAYGLRLDAIARLVPGQGNVPVFCLGFCSGRDTEKLS